MWKVIAPSGGILFLAGSLHVLRPTDYPLPSAYNRAFDASARLVFEDDPKSASREFRSLLKAGVYRGRDSLKNHVDPRTYEYLRRFFALRNVAETEFARLRPWLIDILITSPPPEYYGLGVEGFLLRRALANSKPVSGLESAKDHNQVLVGLSDRESEALLLITFINAGQKSSGASMVDLWRQGDADTIARLMHEAYRDLPDFGERLLDARNRNWLPKLEKYLRSGQTYFVVVGAAHMGGPSGLLSLLRTRGYKVEQL
ncbi:MAG TPA: TraB/GumN family protein [Chthoniobacterales bacterium]|nr:TraB/GumN family protein [Chthoniobacterales bacterium]